MKYPKFMTKTRVYKSKGLTKSKKKGRNISVIGNYITLKAMVLQYRPTAESDIPHTKLKQEFYVKIPYKTVISSSQGE